MFGKRNKRIPKLDEIADDELQDAYSLVIDKGIRSYKGWVRTHKAIGLLELTHAANKNVLTARLDSTTADKLLAAMRGQSDYDWLKEAWGKLQVILDTLETDKTFVMFRGEEPHYVNV